MRKVEDEEPLFPPWIVAIVVRVGPLAVLFAVWWVVTRMLKVPSAVATPLLIVLALSVAIYLGARLYKPFHVEKGTGKCIARGAKQRQECRHYFPGARIGGGCGRQREDGRCRYVRRETAGGGRF
ncbi:MAG TPA: hypothetical protein VMY87_06930 [Armatimonadota bacterium]|nr:hypothetical protein [Armatimonadota bacterium]